MARFSADRPDGPHKAGPSRALSAVLAVLVLVSVAALASRSALSGSLSSGSALGKTNGVSGPWVLAVISAGGVVAAFTLIYSIRSGGLHRRPARRRRKGFGFLSAANFVMFVVLIALVVRLLAPGGHTGSSALHAHASKHLGHLHAAGSSSPLAGWLPVAALSLLVVADVVILAMAFIPIRNRSPVAVEPPGAETVRSAVDASLQALRDEPDPRRAVIAAYRVMELTLSEAGLPRLAPESPREYLRRALGSLELSSAPLSTLTGLFERARFSLRRIDAAQRDAAVGALLEIRHELEVDLVAPAG